MSDIAIRCEGLSKQYRIGKRERYRALRDVLTDAMSAPFRALGSAFRNSDREVRNSQSEIRNSLFWALDDVSFEIKHGEVVGIIGRNGAGKSTLLKILSRITEPTRGFADINGRVGSLLEVGTGFHPELTGRENVYLNGAILGMKKAEIERRFDEIVAFAETEKFLDTPVKYYSSGMQMRLAFAVAAHLEPEILLVDEVLAVGDAEFQKKCLGKMGDVAKEGRTVLFVSHNMAAMQTLCSRAIRLEKAHLMEDGQVNQVVANYLKSNATELLERYWDDLNTAPGNENGRLIYAGVSAPDGYDGSHLTVSTPINLSFRLLNLKPNHLFHFNVLVHNQENICVFNTASRPEVYSKGTVEGICFIPAHLLNDNIYTVRFLAHFNTSDGIDVHDVLTFEVHDADTDREIWGWYGKWIGVIRPRLDWLTRVMSPPSNEPSSGIKNDECTTAPAL